LIVARRARIDAIGRQCVLQRRRLLRLPTKAM
jgi:hypothetical protein